MKKVIFLPFPAFFSYQLNNAQNQILVEGLRTQNLTGALGIDGIQPHLNWKLKSTNKNVMQTAYEIVVMQNKKVLWNTGKVAGSESIHVAYKGESLQSDTKYFWKVRVWDNKGNVPEWSKTTVFRTSFSKKSPWAAKWLEIGFNEDTIRRPVQLFRKEFSIKKKIASANLYITSHDLYKVQLNGKKVGEDFLTPGWTSYNKRLQYQAYNFTNSLNTNTNAIGVSLENSWYRGNLSNVKLKNIFGNTLGIQAQINISYSYGSKEVLITDQNLKYSTGAIKFSELYHGQIRDANDEKLGWSNAKFTDAAWQPVITKAYSSNNLIATENELVKKQYSFKAIKLVTTPKGEKVIDFGQNLVDWAKIKISGNVGDSHHSIAKRQNRANNRR